MSWLHRLLNTVRPSRMQREIERELAFHLAERVDELRGQGVSEEEAKRRARLQFGNPIVQAERTRDVDIAGWLDALFRNLRYASRAIARAPGFAATVVITLGVGIGANTAVFSVVDAVLLEPLPFPNADRLVRVRQVGETETPIAPARLDDWRRLSSAFEALTGYYVEDVSETTGSLPERVRRAGVAPQFLEVWEISPALGRGFTEAEHRFGGVRAVLISDRYWRTRLGADPGVLNRTLRIEGELNSIVGIMPASFLFPDRNVDIWWPYPIDIPTAQNRELQWYTGIGRLEPGVTLEQARTDLALVQAHLAREYPATDAAIGVRIVPLQDVVVGNAGGSLWLLFGAVSVLLLIASTNVAALLLSRAARRQHEVTLRLSLGASRAVVAWQLLSEAALLACAGAVAGLLVATGASTAIRALAPDLPRLDEVGIDARILGYTIASTVIVALLCGVLPAIRSTRTAASLTRGERTQVSAGQSIQWMLVGVQMALSVTLLAGAGLLLRSVDALSRVESGFDAERVLAFRVSGNWNEEDDRPRLVQRINGTLDELGALPGVVSAATSWSLPGVPRQFQIEFALVEGRSESEPPLIAEWRTVSPGYFSTLRMGLVAGELCRGPADARLASEVMVNRSFADRYFRGRTVIGHHLSWEAASQTARVVGVVADARELGLDREPSPTVYACDSAPSPFPWYLVRAQGDPLALAGAIRWKLKELEPLRSIYDIAPLEMRMGDAYAQNRLRTILLLLFAVTALSLACLGIYGTLSYAVSVRRREIGLRLALGGRRREIVQHLVARCLRVVGAACVCGVALSIGASRALSGMLYGVSPWDPITLASVVAIVILVGCVAALVPATRASWIEPMQALREE